MEAHQLSGTDFAGLPALVGEYHRRRPHETVLYRVVLEHLERPPAAANLLEQLRARRLTTLRRTPLAPGAGDGHKTEPEPAGRIDRGARRLRPLVLGRFQSCGAATG